MHKKIDIQDLDIPKDDIECWERYPKHRWIYDLSRLLDAQNIKWSPFETKNLQDLETNLNLESVKSVPYKTSHIYINRPIGNSILSEVYITKGEIKLIRHFNPMTLVEITESVGNVELRISAFVTMYFQKFIGVITTETIGNDIVSIKLRPRLSLAPNAEAARLIKRIYKKNDSVHIIGPTDHVFHESLAS